MGSDVCDRCRWEMACAASAAILSVVLSTAPAHLVDLRADSPTEDHARPLLPREA